MSETSSAARSIDIDGLTNLREVGGWRTAEGQRMRSGLLYRSEAPRNLRPSALRELANLGIVAVLDLRSSWESSESATTLPDGVRRLRAEVSDRQDDGRGSVLDEIVSGRLRSFTPHDLSLLYCRMVDNYPAAFGSAISLIARSENLPVLVHCAVGKDRTGILVALLLDLLGVARSEIIADYAITAGRRAYRRRELQPSLAAVGLEVSDVEGVFSSAPSVLTATFEHIQAKYGSSEKYLREHSNVSPGSLDAVRKLFIE
ncbi:MAG TPA: tyrosine-protein phosphatase [Pseudonocardia sp.]|nr:tyrosine-protein phosphatase [Pseudonocardia sp.]